MYDRECLEISFFLCYCERNSVHSFPDREQEVTLPTF